MSFRRYEASAVLRAFVGSLLMMFCGEAFAQSATPEGEYRKLLRVNEDIQPLGENAFGEQISLYNGSTSFRQVDISATGQGPLLQLARTFSVPDYNPDLFVQPFLSTDLVDWSLEVPHLETLSAVYTIYEVSGPPRKLWFFSEDTARCTRMQPGPDLALPIKQGPDEVYWWADEWWLGYQLHIPGQGKQDILYRGLDNNGPNPSVTLANGAPMVFPAGTRQHWRLGCLPQLANGPGEGFLAISPDGTKYTLDWMVQKDTVGITKAGGGGFDRRIVKLMATRVEDRFGNALAYRYDTSGNLIEIEGTDGRKLTLAYDTWKHGSGFWPASRRLVSATLQPASGAPRTWRYNYSNDKLPRLTSVGLPDGSSWTFNMGGLRAPNSDAIVNYLGCSVSINNGAATSSSASMTAPSGLSGSFSFRTTVRGRADVQYACLQDGAQGEQHLAFQNLYTVAAITRKEYSGPGLSPMVWQFGYSSPNESWDTQCNGCQSEVWSDTIDPAGNTSRSVFSNREDETETQLKRVEQYAGGVNAASLIRKDVTQYAAFNRGPWPANLGSTLQLRMNTKQAGTITPVSRREIYVDGDHYIAEVGDYDAFARETLVTRRNEIAGQAPITERTSFLDDTPHWVLGLPLQVDNVSIGETVSRNVYEPSRLTLAERYGFGRKVMSYTFNPQGLLASFTDGNGHTTALENYYRGIPRIIRYPDGNAQTVAVDDFGQVSAIADQAGAVTSYSYDAVGRLARIDYPAGDSVAWAPKTFQYYYLGAARGIAGAHWVRLVTQGNWSQRTDYDAMLRPVALGMAEANTGVGYVSSRSDYDWAGRKTFQSYTVDGMPDLAGMDLGTVTRYDALGRPIQQFQHTELGDLLTTTAYLSGGARRVTDPKGNATTTRYQLFDKPSFDNVIAVEAPEGVVQTIQRDIYGNPRSITQGGQGASLTKTMTYDGEYRLCRTWEHESGSEIMAYDGADNLAWSVSGASFNGIGCGQDQVADALKTVRGYDAMNRVTSVVYPAGTEPSSFTYDARGNPATATAGMTSWTFGRNKLGLLTAEVMSIDGWSWALGYGYDPKGSLSTVAYPDGNIVSYAPNGLRQPTQVSGYASGISYFPDGDVKSYTLGNGAIYTADKNARQLLRNFTYGKNGTPNVSEDFAYDANGNVSQINDVSGANQRSKAMGYDGLNRLVSATASQLWGTESYTYDTLNNIRTLTNGSVTNTYNYDGSNRLSSISNGASVLHTFNYDARGNTMAKDSQTLNFDLANRLTSIPGKGTYTYDAAGRRVKKVTPQGTTYYAYNAAGQLMWEYNPATTSGTKYVYLGKKLIANVKEPTSKVIGTIDGLNGGDNASINGWACSTGLVQSIDVHVYVGAPGGADAWFGAFHADMASEPRLHEECKANGTAYRFWLALPESLRLAKGGQPIYVYGISPVGNENSALVGSGTLVVPRSVTVPPKPGTATASLSGDLSAITVSWSASATATRYEAWQVHNGQWTALYTGSALSATVGQPTDGPYVFEIRACNDNGCSDFAETAQINVAHLPATPGSINIPASSTGSVAISWAAAAYATSYQVEHSYDGSWTQVYNGTATSATITETVSSNWYYRVRACNANGCGGYATSSYVPVVVPPKAAPALFGSGNSNTGTYTLSWTGVDGTTAYNLVESANGGGWQQVMYAAAGNWTASGKQNGNYVYQIQACNAGGCGPWSTQVVVSVALVPPAPSSVWIDDDWVNPWREVRTLMWTESPNTTYYQVYNLSTQQMYLSNVAPNKREIMVENGEPPLSYHAFQVRACNAVGCSAWVKSSG